MATENVEILRAGRAARPLLMATEVMACRASHHMNPRDKNCDSARKEIGFVLGQDRLAPVIVTYVRGLSWQIVRDVACAADSNPKDCSL